MNPPHPHRSPLGPFAAHWLPAVLVATGLVTALVVWTAVLVHLDEQRGAALADAFRRAQGLTRAFQEHTERALQQGDLIARMVAHEAASTRGNDALVDVARRGQGDVPGVVAVTVADALGQVVASSLGVGAGAGANIADREHFAVHQAGNVKGLFISKPVLGRVSKKWTVQLSRRVDLADGGFGGVVVVSVDPTYFSNFYSEQQFGKKGVISFVGQDWVVRARRSGERVWFGDTAGQNYLAPQVARASEGSYAADSKLDGVRRLIAYKVLPNYPVVVFTGLAEQEVLAETETKARTALLLSAGFTFFLMLTFGGLSVLAWRLRRGQHQLESATQRLEAAVETSLKAFFIFRAVRGSEGVDFELEHCNTRGAQLFGQPAERIIGRPLRDMAPAVLFESIHERYLRVLTSGKPSTRDLTLRVLGEERCFEENLSRLEGGVAVRLRDVTAQRQSSDSLVARCADVEALRDALPFGVLRIDALGLVRHATPAFTRLTGLTPAAIVGKDWLSIVLPDDRLQAQAAFETMAGREELRVLRFRARTADGVRWVSAHVAPVRVYEQPSGYVVTLVDVTDTPMRRAPRVDEALAEPV
jgi:PAS domain S-box-containing protein